MAKKYVEQREEMGRQYKKYLEKQPKYAEKLISALTEAYADGALDGKTKRLMAMAIAVTHDCEGCALAQTAYALDHGASVDEILEAVNVAVSIGGTLAAAGSTRVVGFLEDAGAL